MSNFLINLKAGAHAVEKARRVSKTIDGYEFSTTQVDLPADLAARVIAWGKNIAADKLMPDDGGGDGREDKPHVTVLYGLHTDSPIDVERVINNTPLFAAKVILGRVSIFETPDCDVVKIDVHSPGLERLNEALKTIPAIKADSYNSEGSQLLRAAIRRWPYNKPRIEFDGDRYWLTLRRDYSAGDVEFAIGQDFATALDNLTSGRMFAEFNKALKAGDLNSSLRQKQDELIRLAYRMGFHPDDNIIGLHAPMLSTLRANTYPDWESDIDQALSQLRQGRKPKLYTWSGDKTGFDVSNKSLPHTSSLPVYRPHVTVAYVKKGSCGHLTGDESFVGEEFLADEITFNDRQRTKTILPLVDADTPATLALLVKAVKQDIATYRAGRSRDARGYVQARTTYRKQQKRKREDEAVTDTRRTQDAARRLSRSSRRKSATPGTILCKKAINGWILYVRDPSGDEIKQLGALDDPQAVQAKVDEGCAALQQAGFLPPLFRAVDGVWDQMQADAQYEFKSGTKGGTGMISPSEVKRPMPSTRKIEDALRRLGGRASVDAIADATNLRTDDVLSTLDLMEWDGRVSRSSGEPDLWYLSRKSLKGGTGNIPLSEFASRMTYSRESGRVRRNVDGLFKNDSILRVVGPLVGADGMYNVYFQSGRSLLLPAATEIEYVLTL